ncbi:nascent polypeptide-associated complex subunit alpha, muscle-specific form-like isoform X1 [Scylla paramamosain]
MPISPYYAQNGYGTRSYVRSNSSSNLAGMGAYYSPVESKVMGSDHAADYFRSKYIIPEEGPVKSYLQPRYNAPSRSNFQLRRMDSSDNLYERRNPLQENRLQKSTSTSSFLTGSTPSYLKSSNSSDSLGRSYPYSPTKPRAFTSNLPSPSETPPSRPMGRCGGESSYARAYLANINKGRGDRPREIDTRDINTSIPRTPKWLKANKSEDDGGNISRNRQVVRLTIKREKPEPQDPFTIRNKTLQTIAQRLIDKYQVPEKKPDPLPEPRKRPFYLGEIPPQVERSREVPSPLTSKPPVPSSASAPATPVTGVPPPPPPPPKVSSMIFPEVPMVVERVPKPLIPVLGDKKEEDMSLILQRATENAETKKELESWEEVKDAIVAAVLHPDVDIESDEEINKLIEGEEPPSPAPAEVPEPVKVKVEEPRRDSMDKGLAIMGQLKRFVQRQESTKRSTKRPSKKHSRGSKKSKKSADEATGPPDDDPIAPKTTESSQAQSALPPRPAIEKKQKKKESGTNGSAVERIEESRPAGNTTGVGKEEDTSAQKGNKTAAKKESSILSPSLVLGNEATQDDETTKGISGNTGQCQKTSGKSGNACDKKENSQDTSLLKTRSKDAPPSVLSPDLVLGSPGQDGVTEDSSTSNDNTEAQHKQTKAEKSSMKPDVKEETKDVPGTKIPKIKKKMKTSAAAVKEVSGDALRPSATRAAPPSDLPLPSPVPASPAERSPTQDAPRETHKKQSRDTPVLARTADTQPPDRQMESPSALETLKSIMREEVECAAAKDSPTGGKTKQVTAGNSTSDAATDLETSRVGASCLTQGHKNEKAVKVESSEHLEAAEKGLDARKLNSSASKQEAGEKTAHEGKKELKTLKERKETENNKTKDSGESTQTEAGIDRDKKVDGIKSAIPRWKIKDRKTVNEASDELKSKDNDNKNVTEKDNIPYITKNSEIKSSPENKEESKEKTASSIQDASRITPAIQKEKLEGESDNKGQAADSSEGGRDKEDVMSLKGNAKPTQAVSEGAGPEGGAPPNTLPVKRVLKRPRQVAPPPVSEKDTANELLKARNILKRPVKPGTAAPAETVKENAANVTEITTRPAWKKPIPQLAPSGQGDQIAPAKNLLKRQGKPKEEDKVEKQAETPSEVKVKKLGKKAPAGTSADTAANEGSESGQEIRGRVVKKQRPTYSRSASSSSSSGDEQGSTVRKKAEKPKRITKPISATKKTPSPEAESGSPRAPGTPTRPDTPPSAVPPPASQAPQLKKTEAQQTGSEAATGGKEERREGGAATLVAQVPEKSTSGLEKKAGPEVIPEGATEVQAGNGGAQACTTGVAVGASQQSADSGYGSSPSTPLPTITPTPSPAAPPIEDVEEKCPVCGTNCHKKCEKQMPNLCGVNQKLLAEALSSVKKGGSADGTTKTIGTPPKACSSSASMSEAESTEEETESTDTDYDFFGPPEIRPPLQSCPKYRKYNVDDFEFIKVLGKGSYGKVMLAKQAATENYFAVKCLKKDVVLEDNDVECTLIERKVLSLGTKHPYLCHLFCTFQTPSHLFFVMEYLTGGDLMFHIQHCGRFDEFRACFYGAEITSGLKFLHGKGIIYRDLKLDNILLDYQGHIRIADFGMCKLQVYLDRYADTFCGTPDYMAPEVIKGQHYNQCVDWWSFGVLLYEMLTGKSPFKGCDEDHLFWLICNDEPFYPKFLSKEATSILKQLLDKDSTRRLGIPFSPYGEITVHPFFKYIDWNKIERKEVETPYKPRLRHILDVQYFDPLFTKRQAGITPIDESILATMDQKPFKDFSYTNPIHHGLSPDPAREQRSAWAARLKSLLSVSNSDLDSRRGVTISQPVFGGETRHRRGRVIG